MSRPLRVLIVEDSERDALLLQRELRQGGYDPAVARVESAAQLRAALEAATWDLVVADYRLPQFNGMDALELVRAQGRDVPFILVSGVIGEDQAVAAMKAGAHDFILKDKLARLVPAVERELREAEMRQRRRQAEEQVRLQAAALQSTANAILITGRDGTIQWVNAAFTRLTGYHAAEATGQNPRLLSSGQQDLAFYRGLWEAILDGRPWHGELVNKRKDGSLYAEEMSIASVSNDCGEITHFIAVKQDITARKQGERALQQVNSRLDLLANTATVLLRSESPLVAVEFLCQRVLAHLDCQVFFNFLVDDDQQRLRLNAWAGISEAEARKIAWLDYGVAVCGRVARDGSRFVAQDVLDTQDPQTALVRSYGIRAYACHPLKAQDRVLGTLSFGTRTRTCFTEEELSLMRVVADQVAIALERQRAQIALRQANAELEERVAERRRAEEALRQAHDELEVMVTERTADLRRANQMLRMISECNQTLFRVANEEELTRNICRIIQDIGGYTMAWVGLAENDRRKTVRPVAVVGSEDGYLASTRITWADDKYGQGPTGRSIRTGKACLGNDFRSDPELAPWRRQALERGYRSSLALPLQSEGRVFGALTLYAAQPAGFDSSEVEMLSDLANDLAFGIVALRAKAERDQAQKSVEQKAAQLRALAAELTQAEQRERRRLASVLHDHLQQLLVGARYGLETLRDPAQAPQFQQALQHVDLLLGQCIQASRTLTSELSPPVLYEAGLVAALKWLGRWFGETHGLAVRVAGEESDATHPEDIRIALFQAVRELLFNVVKHAQVKKAEVRVSHPGGRELRIVVSDDGVGFDPSHVQAREGSAGRFGLFSVRERLEFLGMRLAIDSAPGRGSRFTLLAPLPDASPASARTSVALKP